MRDLVGREQELAVLGAELRAMLDGQGRSVLIHGEAGIGKTKLARWIVDEAARHGIAAHEGRGRGAAAPPYAPMAAILEPLLDELGDDGENPVCGIVRSAVPDVPGADGERIESNDDRVRLFEAVERLLRDAARRRPRVVVVDDLHAADSGTRRLVRFLARSIRDAPVLLVAVHGASGGDVTDDDVGRLVREATPIELRGLPRDAVRALVEAAAPDADERDVERIGKASGGNPFYALELARHLSSGASAEPGMLPVPESLRHLALERLRSLGATSRRAVVAASVLGDAFDATVVGEVSGLSSSELLAALDEALRAGIVGETGLSGRFAFRHPVTRAAIYEETPREERVLLHARAGASLERAPGMVEPAEVARHFLAAPVREPRKTVEWAMEAGRRAFERRAFEEARQFHVAALDAASAMDDCAEIHGELHRALGATCERLGQVAEAQNWFREGAELARRIGNGRLLAQCALGMAGESFLSIWGRSARRDERLVGLLEEAIEPLGESDLALRSRLSSCLASESSVEVDASRRRRRLADAVRLAREAGDARALAAALRARLVAHADDPEPSVDLATEVVDAAITSGERGLEAYGRQLRMVAHLEAGDVAAADAELDVSAPMARALRQPHGRWFELTTRATRAIMKGRLEEGERLAGEAARAGEASQLPDVVQANGAQMGPVLEARGELAAVEMASTALLEAHPAVTAWRAVRAFARAEIGRVDAARADLDVLAADDFRSFPTDGTWLASLACLAAACRQVGDGDRASILRDLLLPHRGRVVMIGGIVSCWGAVDHALADAAHARGRFDEAIREWDAALRAHRDMEALLLVARTSIPLAEALLERGRPGDRERASGLLEEAGEIADRMGMPAYAEQVARLRGEAAAAPTLRNAGAERGAREGAEPHGVFRFEGDYWTIEVGDEVLRLRDMKGLRVLAHLLARPGEETDVLEIVDILERRPRSIGRRDAGANLSARASLGDAGEVLDARARAAYRRRLRAIDVELGHVPLRDQRREALAREAEMLRRELSGGTGLAGRSRRAASTGERARVAVTKNVRTAIDRIRAHAPALADHLRSTIRTGRRLAYRPEPGRGIRWRQ